MPALAQRVERMLDWMKDWLRRHWQRALLWRERLRLSESAFHLLVAAAIGVIGGLANLIHHHANDLLQMMIFARHSDITDSPGHLHWLTTILTPALGGLAAGLVLYYGLRLLGNPGLSNLLEVVVAGDGRLSLRTAIINAVSSLLSLSTGASIGREGLIVQLSSTLASKAGQLVRWPPYRLRLMVACGAAAGISAAYNAPLAGAVFAGQIVLGNFSMNLFAPLVVASVVASITSRSFFGINQWYVVPEIEFRHLSELPWFLVLGVLCGGLGAGFLKILRWSERGFARLPMPLYVRMMLAGAVVGAIALAYPGVWGNGYTATNQILDERSVTLQFVLGLFVAKLVATSITVGSGAVGGVFTPTLFLGAAAGSIFGNVLHRALGTGAPPETFALVGMGAMLAATTHSPLLAMLMLFELSLNYSLMPALMLACAIATLVARRLHPESIYTEPLLRKGLELARENPRVGAATELKVGDLMQPPVEPLQETTAFSAIAHRFLTSPNNFLPVVDAENRLVGVVALHDMKEHLTSGHELAGVIALDVMRPPPPCLTPDQRLPDALPILLASEQRNVPVVNSLRQHRLIGTVEKSEALGLLSEAITARSTPGI
jgi:chloride channel protein, CIC family